MPIVLVEGINQAAFWDWIQFYFAGVSLLLIAHIHLGDRPQTKMFRMTRKIQQRHSRNEEMKAGRKQHKKRRKEHGNCCNLFVRFYFCSSVFDPLLSTWVLPPVVHVTHLCRCFFFWGVERLTLKNPSIFFYVPGRPCNADVVCGRVLGRLSLCCLCPPILDESKEAERTISLEDFLEQSQP